MKKDEVHSSECKDNLRLNVNTPDSHLLFMTDDTLRQLYSSILQQGGLTLPTIVTSLMERDELILELQFMRALKLLGQQYYLNLFLETLDEPELKTNEKLYTSMMHRLQGWVQRWKNRPPASSPIDPKYDIDTIRALIPDTPEYHIDADSEDEEITELLLCQARYELRYQYSLFPMQTKRDVLQMSYSEILLTLILIRNKYIKIEKALGTKSDNSERASTSPLPEDTKINPETILTKSDKECVNMEIDYKPDSVNNDIDKSIVTPEKNSQRNQGSDVHPFTQDIDYEAVTMDVENASENMQQDASRQSPEHTEQTNDLSLMPANQATTRNSNQNQNRVTSFGDLGGNSDNLLGYDVMQIGRANTESSQDGNICSALAIKKHYFFLRAKLPVNDESTHIPALVKKFIKVLREADTSFMILPFSTSVRDNLQQDQHIITDEEQLPDNV